MQWMSILLLLCNDKLPRYDVLYQQKKDARKAIYNLLVIGDTLFHGDKAQQTGQTMQT